MVSIRSYLTSKMMNGAAGEVDSRLQGEIHNLREILGELLERMDELESDLMNTQAPPSNSVNHFKELREGVERLVRGLEKLKRRMGPR
ncbi:MAG: hypothetical protein ACE5GD_06390 [Candidatus Geothermarchaeales archaeon]